jgi:cytochrome c553
MRALLATLAVVACQPAGGLVPSHVPPPITRAASAGEAAGPRPPVPAPPSRPPPSAQFEHDMMVRYHMHGNLDLMRAIERLLLRGKLDESRELARAIAAAPTDPDLGAWAAQAATVRERAAALAAAPGLDEACRRVARLAEACASCHVETRVQPELRTPPPVPPDKDTLAARMARHRWAADRLWEGMVGGDDGPWRAGLAVLAATPLRWPELSERRSFARLLQQLADQARQRASTDSLADRARSYGDLLVTCAACHTMK